MTFALRPTYDDNPRLDDLVTRLRDYLSGELAEYEADLGLEPETPLRRSMLEPVWRRSRELGFYGVHLPEHLGGRALSLTELAALKEEVGASGRVLATSVLGDMGGPLRVGAIFEHATDHQVHKYLLPVVRAERACCFSMTEDDAGSDVRRMRTTATPVPGGYRITGHKVFSTGGTFADFAILVARMDGDEESYSAFLVDLDSPGCRVLPGQVPLSGQNIESDVVLDDCFVPAENLLGQEGQGLRISLGRVTANRLLHCPTALGAARRAFGLAFDFAAGRAVSGGLLLEKQAVQHKLADMATDYYAARSMTYDALAALDAGHRPRLESFMCKLFVGERAFAIADQAVQLHGKAGMVRGAPVEVIWRQLRMFRVLTGASEIQREGIIRELVTAAGGRS
ncbi:acyl-CoA dehydrogenase family protein [Nocardiopsis aegyptia]|uniref:Alkylation response protein AidB-like acyl-CoA dehydrogenase n=1 Tax=Nocardiopsis aegyptia TaxID=220378 RepID=A0A7Z0J877_9ACTN|nr:acyl-CoA dehydrogenase [Nocardiopsis aegyptia]NYJ32149.1 alkylation response protein AidB-like acyl-CoA dehydrogenase [Nocardiopsis aegyptia]